MYVDGEIIERISVFGYLGTMVCENWNLDVQIRSRIEQDRETTLLHHKGTENRIPWPHLRGKKYARLMFEIRVFKLRLKVENENNQQQEKLLLTNIFLVVFIFYALLKLIIEGKTEVGRCGI